MKKANYILIFRYTILTLFITIVLYMISIVQENALSSFDFNHLFFMYFIGFTLIGCALHIVNDNIFNKDFWELKLKPEILIFVIIYFFISISLFANIGVLINIYLRLRLPASLVVMMFQILFGHTFIRLFHKKG